MTRIFPDARSLTTSQAAGGRPVIVTLAHGELRFHLLRDQIVGVSEKMLSQTLKMLARDGLIARSVEPSVPPKVTYELTALGHDAAGPLKQIVEWLGKHIPEITGAQERFDAMTRRAAR